MQNRLLHDLQLGEIVLLAAFMILSLINGCAIYDPIASWIDPNYIDTGAKPNANVEVRLDSTFLAYKIHISNYKNATDIQKKAASLRFSGRSKDGNESYDNTPIEIIVDKLGNNGDASGTCQFKNIDMSKNKKPIIASIIDKDGNNIFPTTDIFTPYTTSDSSYGMVSAIKSIFGQKPSNEFFDFSLRFRLSDKFATVIGGDINIQNDTIGSTQKYFTEASGILNISPWTNADNERQFVFGPIFKIFNTVPYSGFQIGGYELTSQFRGSYFLISYLYSLYNIDTSFSHSINKNLFRNNLYFEFALYSARLASFTQFLRIKGGILFPLPWGKSDPSPVLNDIVTRIAIEVPIGGFINF